MFYMLKYVKGCGTSSKVLESGMLVKAKNIDLTS